MEWDRAGSPAERVAALSDKEKQTLRLLLVGHDAKSLARQLGLSVHTVNERLRDARRKLAVSSSKEAARLLHAAERANPQSLRDDAFGAAPAAAGVQPVSRPGPMRPPPRRAVRASGGMAMTLLLAALLTLSASQPDPHGAAPAPSAPAVETAAGTAARAWLALVDAARWPESWAATGASFRSANSVGAWQAASERVRVPLGPVVSRTLAGEEDTPAPPAGYRTVRFRTDFAHRRGAVETVALDEEEGRWKVVGVYIE